MNDIKKEQTTTIKIYREFFAKAQAEVKKQLAIIKTPSSCNGCHQCCKIRYTELSPKELKNGTVFSKNNSIYVIISRQVLTYFFLGCILNLNK